MVVHGGESEIERFALAEIQRNIQTYLPYVVEIRKEAPPEALAAHHVLILGTRKTNPLIAALADDEALSIPKHSEGYTMACVSSPWEENAKLIVLAGQDARGVLYAVQDFCSRILAATVMPDYLPRRREALDGIAEFCVSEHPRIANRGIWTWGYVIYDYRRFFDNMARLRLNMATIWNDDLPVNCHEVIDYAHGRGVKVVLGFPWGWGYDMDISNSRHRQKIKEFVLSEFSKKYQHLPIDGLYLQTDTEHAHTARRGRSMAYWACTLVNDVAGELLKLHPGLSIQFGLHATSVQENYRELRALDSRVTITWEDAGMIPYANEPIVSWTERETIPLDVNVANWLETKVGSPKATVSYSKKLATLRKGAEFAMVPKGWVAIRWPEEFEHHGPFLLGERSDTFIQERFEGRKARWDKMNQMWIRRFPLAQSFYREILKTCPKMTVTGLIEDGLFERQIQPSVALFAHTLWNPGCASDELLKQSLSPYYYREGSGGAVCR